MYSAVCFKAIVCLTHFLRWVVKGVSMGVFWLLMIVIFAAAEIFTYQLVSVWFAGGAVGALIAYIAGGNLTVQWIVFVVVSIVFLAASRPLARKLKRKTPERTNADGLVGKTARITERVDNINGSGQAVIGGIAWTVRSADGETIEPEEQVVIEKIEGVKLIVRK